MNLRMPTEEEIRTAFAQGATAVVALFHNVTRQVAVLAQQLAQQGEVLQALPARLATSSRTSGKPPASDGYGNVPRPPSRRQAGHKATGGQPGHEGQTLRAVEQPAHTVIHTVALCPHCQASLHDTEVAGYAERQVFALPALRLEVTAHRAARKVCPACGHARTGCFPAPVSPAVQYGPTVTAWASYCTNDHPRPVERTTAIFADLVHHPVSEATVLKASEQLDVGIAPATEAIQARLREAAVLHVDESGLRVQGTLPGLHVAGPSRLPSYAVHTKRGQAAMEDADMLGHCTGMVVHDPWKPYFAYHACRHALCNAHHLRALACIAQQYHQAWAREMTALLLEMKAEVEATPRPAMRVAPPALAVLTRRYDAVVQAGCAAHLVSGLPATGAGKKRGRPKQPPAVNLLLRLRDFTEEILAFTADCRGPCDHNQGERDIRMVQGTQKVSGGFRTLDGAQRFGRIRGSISTVRKQAANVFEAIRDALEGHPFLPSPTT
jgi:transposase